MTRDEHAIWSPSPNFWPGRMGYKPRWLIVHGTAGMGAVSWLDGTASHASTHYVVKQDGSIYQLVDEDASAWGNGILEPGHDLWWSNDINPNFLTISVEHEKPDMHNMTPLTAAQALASFQLIARICARWNIPMRQADASGGITGHFSLQPTNRRDCPGAYPWSSLWQFFASASASSHQAITQNGESLRMLTLSDPMGQFFSDAGNNRWQRKDTAISLAYAHLDFYRKYEGIFGLPLTNEIYLAQLPGTAIVIYERAIAIYDPKHTDDPVPGGSSVYLMHLNKGIGQQIVAKPLTSVLEAEISRLQDDLEKKPADNDIAALNARLASYEAALQQVSTIVSNTEKKGA